jgi:hypothetical protein
VTEDESEPCVYGAIIDMAVTVNFRKGGNLSVGHEARRGDESWSLWDLCLFMSLDSHDEHKAHKESIVS